MTNRSLFLAFSFLLSGCTHMHVEQWAGGQMEICGRRASADDMRELAQQKGCTNPAPIGGRTLRDGSVKVDQNILTGQPIGVSAKSEQCVTFKCG